MIARGKFLVVVCYGQGLVAQSYCYAFLCVLATWRFGGELFDLRPET